MFMTFKLLSVWELGILSSKSPHKNITISQDKLAHNFEDCHFHFQSNHSLLNIHIFREKFIL